jgi:hypothetical protein
MNRYIGNDGFPGCFPVESLAGKSFSLPGRAPGKRRKPLIAAAFAAVAQRFSAPEAIFSRVFPCGRETG